MEFFSKGKNSKISCLRGKGNNTWIYFYISPFITGANYPRHATFANKVNAMNKWNIESHEDRMIGLVIYPVGMSTCHQL